MASESQPEQEPKVSGPLRGLGASPYTNCSPEDSIGFLELGYRYTCELLSRYASNQPIYVLESGVVDRNCSHVLCFCLLNQTLLPCHSSFLQTTLLVV